MQMINMKSTFNISTVIVIVTGMLSAMCSCNNHPSNNLADENKDHGNIIAQTFKTNDGWGYSVLINNKLFIKQSIIPVIEGYKAFANEEDAKKVAGLVVNKLKHHEKPILRLDELQRYGIGK